ncbi:MAG: glycosyl hydrolase 115 family protein [Prevotella sp.]|nr:glycosyl hydrolase 115 family protein [Prevotella sp.]
MSLGKRIITMKRLLLIICAVTAILSVHAQSFCISERGKAAPIAVDNQDWPGVIRAAGDLADDIRKVTGTASRVVSGSTADTASIIVGTIGKSRIIDRLVRQRKLNVSQVRGRWESFVIDVIDGNLVIAGSDKRGTIYGIYTVSEHIGVSPWYWWADVPVMHKSELYWTAGRFVQPSPKVKYRGIFINDEWPSFGSWATEHFGGVNSRMYAHMFELLLRLKANYLWPAMWDSRFNEDDPESPRLADEYGIVMGTSHHEPMMRAHKEYVYRKDSIGPWDYSVNKERLDRFFLEGLQRNRAYENLVTIGMRGDGDVAMGRGDDADNMNTLRDVIKGQRRIIKNVYGREDGVPQLWAIFTEVQRYYDAGFTVPDDVTLLLCDNNWGYIRRIGRDFERRRKGGLGLYYHIDMNGGPWNDRWVNTTTLPKLREQLSLAYQTGIDRIWIINVGDLKPKEVPIDFIMHYAWNPDAIQPGDEQQWLEAFTNSVFGGFAAKEAADLISKYTKYNLWRKAEAQVPGIFNMEEMAMTDSLWLSLAARAEALRTKIPAEAQDAYYQLVYYPVVASAGVALLYNAATRGNAPLVGQLMARDRQLSDYYHQIAGGKWNKMMQDKHIGYTQWSMPQDNTDPTTLNFNTGHAMQEQPATNEYSIPAWQFARKTDGQGASWLFLPDLGRGRGCMGSSNVLAQNSGAVLEYDIDNGQWSMANGQCSVAIGILPTQDIYPARGLRIGVQIDNQPMQTIDARRGLVDTFSEYNPQNLARSNVLTPLPPHSRLALSGFWNGRQLPRRDEVFDNIRWLDATFTIENTPNVRHTLKIIMIDPEVVVEQIVINPDNNHYSYFGNYR